MRPYFLFALTTSTIFLLTAYFLALSSYVRGEIPPFVAILVIFTISPLYPFVLSLSFKTQVVTRRDVWNASKGASLAMSIAMVSAVILLLVFDSGIIAQPEPTAFLVGLPIMFFGSSLLPWLASATTLALDIVDPETREGVLSRVSAIPESFIILTLALSTGSRPPRQIILRSLTWTLTILVLPLAMGWLLVARVVGPISWIIPPIYYGLLLWFTNRQIHLIASRDLETLSASIRPMPVPPGPSSRSEIAWLIFILIFYGYLLISILRSPFL